jgi:hypothetical protein
MLSRFRFIDKRPKSKVGERFAAIFEKPYGIDFTKACFLFRFLTQRFDDAFELFGIFSVRNLFQKQF